jgi:hypothetical protein
MDDCVMSFLWSATDHNAWRHCSVQSGRGSTIVRAFVALPVLAADSDLLKEPSDAWFNGSQCLAHNVFFLL